MGLQLGHCSSRFLVLLAGRIVRRKPVETGLPCPLEASNSIAQQRFAANPDRRGRTAPRVETPATPPVSAVNGEQHGFSVAWKSIISVRIPSGSYMLNWYFPSSPIFAPGRAFRSAGRLPGAPCRHSVWKPRRREMIQHPQRLLVMPAGTPLPARRKHVLQPIVPVGNLLLTHSTGLLPRRPTSRA